MSDTKNLAIIGNPIEHSFSPAMHNYISKKMGLDYVYGAICAQECEFDNLITSLECKNYAGVNITSPFKFNAYKTADVLSEKAKKFGSVNTCVFKEGKIYGYNTDADGLYKSLLSHGVAVADKDILFIGAGGATKPAVVYFSELGAKSISIHNRTVQKAQEISDYVKKLNNYDIEIGINKNHYDLVINTTTVGMSSTIDLSPVNEISFIDENTFVYDMIYNPEKTVFLKMAEENGAKTANGLGMLIYQGIIAYELFTGVTLPDTIYNDILSDVFGK